VGTARESRGPAQPRPRRDADYEILDRVALLKCRPPLRVCVVTQDLGMRVRAESMELEVLPAPPDGTVPSDGHLPESSP
jgi:predicted ribonuclease YlaK